MISRNPEIGISGSRNRDFGKSGNRDSGNRDSGNREIGIREIGIREIEIREIGIREIGNREICHLNPGISISGSRFRDFGKSLRKIFPGGEVN